MTIWIRNKVIAIFKTIDVFNSTCIQIFQIAEIVSSLAVSPIYLLFMRATISYCFAQIVYEWSRNIYTQYIYGAMHPIKYPCFLNRIEMILHSCF